MRRPVKPRVSRRTSARRPSHVRDAPELGIGQTDEEIAQAERSGDAFADELAIVDAAGSADELRVNMEAPQGVANEARTNSIR